MTALYLSPASGSHLQIFTARSCVGILVLLLSSVSAIFSRFFHKNFDFFGQKSLKLHRSYIRLTGTRVGFFYAPQG